MRLGMLRTDRGPVTIAVDGDRYLRIGESLGAGDAPWAKDLRALIEAGEPVLRQVRDLPGRRDAISETADPTRLGPPIATPRRILCIGINYREHAQEMGHALPEYPEIFLRLPSTLAGPYDPIPMPEDSERFDLEVELTMVIGRGGRRISREEAMDHVFGYTLFNDLSVRDVQKRGTQWTPGKNFDGCGPCGPFVVTADEVPDPAALDIRSAIDDFEMQHSNTRNLIFDLPSLIEDVSRFTTLEPGDLIVTGTPPGVGDGRKPPRYLRVGETAHCRIEGLGELANRVVPEREWQKSRDLVAGMVSRRV